MGVGIDNWVFVEHLPVVLVLLKRLKVSDLVFNFRLDFAKLLRDFSVRKSTTCAITVHETSLRFVRGHNMASCSLWTTNSRNEIVRTPVSVLSEGWYLLLQASLLFLSATFALFSNALCRLPDKLVHLLAHWYLIGL